MRKIKKETTKQMLKRLPGRAAAAAAALIMISALPAPMRADALSPVPDKISMMTDNKKDLTEITELLAKGILEHRKEIDVSGFGYRQELAFDIVKELMAKYPEIFFLNRKTPVYYTMSGGKILSFCPNYCFSKEETDKKLSEFYKEAEKFLGFVSGNYSQLEKTLILHDALVENMHFKLDEEKGSNYELLVKKEGVCENYTRVYAYLLGQLGIKTELVDSDKMNHEWLKAEIGGAYYNIDVTWDDPSPEQMGRVSHKYFMVSDKKITEHTDYKSINSASDTTYDNGTLQCISSRCIPVNGIVYCVYNGGGKSCLAAASFKDGTRSASMNLTNVTDLSKFGWSAGGGRTWLGNFTALTEYKGRLYYNSANEVFCYDPVRRTNESVYKLTGGGSIYGLRAKADGKLIGLISDSPNSAGKEKELCSVKKQAFSSAVKQIKRLSQIKYSVKITGVPKQFAKDFSETTGFLKDKKISTFTKIWKK